MLRERQIYPSGLDTTSRSENGMLYVDTCAAMRRFRFVSYSDDVLTAVGCFKKQPA
jgi:hypothetical protein